MERTREALFNILGHAPWAPGNRPILDGAWVLDAFCGSGALGLEALSRGATRCTFFEISSRALDLARQNAASLAETHRCRFWRGDACRPPPAPTAASLVLADPPYGQGWLERLLPALQASGWMAQDTVVALEAATTDTVPLPPWCRCTDRRRYGDSQLFFAVVHPPDAVTRAAGADCRASGHAAED